MDVQNQQQIFKYLLISLLFFGNYNTQLHAKTLVQALLGMSGNIEANIETNNVFFQANNVFLVKLTVFFSSIQFFFKYRV